MRSKLWMSIVPVLLLAAAVATAAPVRLARTPDYHAGQDRLQLPGRHLGGERGRIEPAAHHRSTRLATSIRASRPTAAGSRSRRTATATTTCSSFRPTGGAPRRLTYHTGDDEVVGWSPDSQARRLPRVARRRRLPRHGDALPGVGRRAGRKRRCPVDWGWWGSYSPDGKHFLFNRHPAVWSRKHYRGSYAADIWIADLAAKTYRQVLAGREVQPLLADVGAEGRDLLRRRSRCRTRRPSSRAARRCARASTTSTRSRPRAGPAGPGDQAHRRQRLLPVDVERRQGDRLRGETSASGSSTSPPAARPKSRSTSSPTRRRTSSRS